METSVFNKVNKASRDRDEAKINTLGPYAYILQTILQGQNATINIGKEFLFENRANGFVVYRGLNVPNEKLKEWTDLKPNCCSNPLTRCLGCFCMFKKKRLTGFSSTTTDRDIALDFASKARD